MFFYLIVAVVVCIYCINSRSMPLGESIVAGLAWPVTFFLYLFTMITGRSVRNPFVGITGNSRGRGKGKGRGRR